MLMKSLGLNAPPEKNNNRSAKALLYGVYGCAAVGVIALHLATNGITNSYQISSTTLPVDATLPSGMSISRRSFLCSRDWRRDSWGSPWTLRLLPSLLGGFLVALYSCMFAGWRLAATSGNCAAECHCGAFPAWLDWPSDRDADQVTWMVCCTGFSALSSTAGRATGSTWDSRWGSAEGKVHDRRSDRGTVSPSFSPLRFGRSYARISLDRGRDRPLDLVADLHLADRHG